MGCSSSLLPPHSVQSSPSPKCGFYQLWVPCSSLGVRYFLAHPYHFADALQAEHLSLDHSLPPFLLPAFRSTLLTLPGVGCISHYDDKMTDKKTLGFVGDYFASQFEGTACHGGGSMGAGDWDGWPHCIHGQVAER